MVVCLSDLLEETNPDGGGVPDGVLEPRPIPSLIHVHVVLEPTLQQQLKKGPHLSFVVPSKEVTTVALGGSDGVGKGQVPEDIVAESISPQLDKDILGLRIRVASATTSPAELRPVERPLEDLEVGLDLSSMERVVGDGVGVVADPAGGGDGGGDGVTASRHDDSC